jgi:histone-lysine N-methyltransferase SETMAR
MLISGVMLRQDNVHLHTVARTQALLEHLNWELSDYPPNSPDLALSNYHLFTYLKKWLGSQLFKNNKLREGAKTWLSSQAGDFFDTGIQKLIPRYDKCLNSSSDYTDQQFNYVRMFCIFSHCLFC